MLSIKRMALLINNLRRNKKLQHIPEMFKKVKDRVEPHVLDATLAIRVEDQSKVFGSTLKVEGQDKFAFPGLTLPHQKRASTKMIAFNVAVAAFSSFPRLLENQLSSIWSA